jgi:enoyl-[acyl-carrier protein] reductase I
MTVERLDTEAALGRTAEPSAEPRLMAGKRGLILGVANDHSIAWGIAQALSRAGAELAFTYQDEAFRRRVEPLAHGLGSRHVLRCDVSDEAQIDAVFQGLNGSWDGLDFLVHAVAYSDKAELRGRYIDTTRENFRRTLAISCYSFTALARRAAAAMPKGGALLTLSYLGGQRVMPSYNVMGVAKAALEASVRYLAVDLGRGNIRVNSLSAGPMRTLAGSAIGDARYVWRYNRDHAPLRRNVTLDEIGGTALYLLSDLSRGVTGEIVFVDAGFHAIGIPPPAQAEPAG